MVFIVTKTTSTDHLQAFVKKRLTNGRINSYLAEALFVLHLSYYFIYNTTITNNFNLYFKN
jgi:hypothetical protein